MDGKISSRLRPQHNKVRCETSLPNARAKSGSVGHSKDVPDLVVLPFTSHVAPYTFFAPCT
ncbi:hypothetical protein BN1708_004069 [Verticillium longisporum]|uniref:Uncharacterized protein n=1 Tax=Verticillium longisporum TaxID=100787 RepID=A0A0G4LV86_VERLO|nr:hypothetical protein BN1708_004069 [Verticillium longisporum]